MKAAQQFQRKSTIQFFVFYLIFVEDDIDERDDKDAGRKQQGMSGGDLLLATLWRFVRGLLLLFAFLKYFYIK